MRKREFFGAITALVMMLFLCIGNGVRTSRITDDLFAETKSCYEAAKQGRGSNTDRLAMLWSDNLGYFECTLPHAEVEAVAQTIMEFSGAMETQDENEYTRAYHVLCEKLAHLKKVDSLSIRNIL